MLEIGLLEVGRGRLGFPPAAFYAYQGYIPTDKRRSAPLTDWEPPTAERRRGKAASGTTGDNQREPATIGDDRRPSAETSASPSPSPSPSPSGSSPVPGPEAKPSTAVQSQQRGARARVREGAGPNGKADPLSNLDEDQRKAIEVLWAVPGWSCDAALDAKLLEDARAIAVAGGARDLGLSVIARELRQWLADAPIKKGDRPRARFTNFVRIAVQRQDRLAGSGMNGHGPPARAAPSAPRRTPMTEELEAGGDRDSEQAAAEYLARYGAAHAPRDPS